MGLTIYYGGGKAASQKKIDELFEYLHGLGKTLGWDYVIKTEMMKGDIMKYTYNKKSEECGEKIVLRNQTVCYKYFHANIDEGCETFRVGFDYNNLEFLQYYRSSKKEKAIYKSRFSCKTQYSHDFINTHNTICVLLDYIKNHCVCDLEVCDEGMFFGNWDKKALEKEIKKWRQMMDDFGEAIDDFNKDKDDDDKISFKRAVRIKENN